MYDIRTRLQVSSIVPLLLLIISLIYLFANTTLRPDPLSVFGYQISGYFPMVLNSVMEAILIFLLSVVFFSIETLVRAYITDTDSETTRAFKNEFEQGSLDQKLMVLFKWDAVPQAKITRSVILQVALLVFTLFAMTSSYSSVGFGVGLSVLLQMLFDQIQLLRKNKDISIWFWQIKTQVSRDSQNMYVGAMVIAYLVLGLMIF